MIYRVKNHTYGTLEKARNAAKWLGLGADFKPEPLGYLREDMYLNGAHAAYELGGELVVEGNKQGVDKPLGDFTLFYALTDYEGELVRADSPKLEGLVPFEVEAAKPVYYGGH